jgi:glycosyltransferase involved in cell wall biosynthesis
MAKLFIFPSIYEGFGLPPLEAMQCGLPVICSDIPSHKEVIGDAGILLPPQDSVGFSSAILNLLDNTEKYNEMKNKSIERAKQFTNRERVLKTIDLFNTI